MTDYPTLFSPGKIGRRTTMNRFVAQPMEGNDADHGAVSERTLGRYRNLAEGQWGIIVVEAISISPASLARKDQLVIDRTKIDGYAKLVQEIKKISPDTVVLFQITHSGRKSGKDFSEAVAAYEPTGGNRLLSADNLRQIQKGFVESTMLAYEAGADGVDLKLCHGYLACELLRPANLRNDEWGGSYENRTRMLWESVQAIRERVKPDDFILGSRISSYEGIRGGCGTVSADDIVEDLSEMDELVRLMGRLDLHYLNVSAGIPGLTSEITRPTQGSKLLYLHQFRYARHAKALAGSMPVIGSAYTVLKAEALDAAEENLGRGDVDFVGWGRQNLADPRFPAKVMQGLEVDYCKLCSGCSKLMVEQKPVGCIFFPGN
jgi:2,4-dienoyl-CoA reductase-like NADH-dependent reductase (Old Yellow Enzyme family)